MVSVGAKSMKSSVMLFIHISRVSLNTNGLNNQHVIVDTRKQ